jgi:hypothetical protein
MAKPAIAAMKGASPSPKRMRELDIYLPSVRNDGHAVDPQIVEQITVSLMNAFGGYTHLKNRCEGAWKMGGVTFRDEVTIIRVLEDASTTFDLHSFRRNLETVLDQEQILIVARDVTVLE